MPTHTPTIELNNGVHIPALGFGVYQSSPQETTGAVRTALDTGYRLIDTAAAYFNEQQVGEAITASSVDRSDIFVTTKVWISDYHDAERAFDVSMRKLGQEHLDLWMLHQPLPSAFDRTIAAYKTAEKLLADGRIRAIGVSNMKPSQLDELIAVTDVVPAVNQIQVHPYYSQPQWRTANDHHGILTQCWAPLGGSYIYGDADTNPLEDETINAIAQRHEKTAAQVVLRWHVEHGFSAIPKSVKTHRIAENFDVFDFSLSSDEIAAIDGLDTGVRGGPDPDTLDLATYSLQID